MRASPSAAFGCIGSTGESTGHSKATQLRQPRVVARSYHGSGREWHRVSCRIGAHDQTTLLHTYLGHQRRVQGHGTVGQKRRAIEWRGIEDLSERHDRDALRASGADLGSAETNLVVGRDQMRDILVERHVNRTSELLHDASDALFGLYR